jgi:hypothetical protein
MLTKIKPLMSWGKNINYLTACLPFWSEDRIINHFEKKYVNEGTTSAYNALAQTTSL